MTDPAKTFWSTWAETEDKSSLMGNFVGSRQFDELKRHLKNGRHVLLTGERGIGKTTLARAAVISALEGQQVEWFSGSKFLLPDEMAAALASSEDIDRIVIDDADRIGDNAIAYLLDISKVPLLFIRVAASLPPNISKDYSHIHLEAMSLEQAIAMANHRLAETGIDIAPEEVSRIARAAKGNPRSLLGALRRALNSARVTSGTHTPSLFLTVDTSVLDPGTIVEILRALNDLYRAYGGDELAIVDGGTHQFGKSGAAV